MWGLPFALAASLTTPACEPMPGWQELANEARGKYLVLGESHGSNEAPGATAEYVCAVADEGPVLVGIEFDSTFDESWQIAWDAPHSEFRRVLFAEISEWGRRNDGVASIAMLALVERLHALRSAGADIDIVAFNGAKDDAQRAAFAQLPGQEPHEAAQAANIREAAQRRNYAHVVVLVGNLHARKAPVTVGSSTFRPMAMLLAEPHRVVSLTMHTEGGETWNCQLAEGVVIEAGKPITDEMLDCSGHRIGTSGPERTRGFHLDAGANEGVYDGLFALGPVTAAPLPAIE